MSSIPSIAGAPVTSWKKDFCPGIIKWSGEPEKSLPLEGSFGLHYSVKGDLSTLYTLCGGRKSSWNAALEGTLKQPTPGFTEKVKPLTPFQSELLFDFVHWALSEQPYFLLRKGRETLGLYRKTSSYIYDPKATMLHRVSFELVSEMSLEQQALYKSQMSRVPSSFFWTTCDIPRATEDAEALEAIRSLRLKVTGLTAELDTLLLKLNA